MQDHALNSRLEQMAVIANMPGMKKPYAVVEVDRYLPLLKRDYPGLFTLIDQQLARYRDGCSISQASVSLSHARGASHPVVTENNLGVTVDSLGQVTVSGHCKFAAWLDVSAGLFHADGLDDALPIDSYVAVGSEAAQLEFGYRDRWFSPMQSSAMLLSTNARPSISLGITNGIPWEDYWNFRYEIFVAKLETRESILYGEQVESGRPALLGTHLSIEPLAGWHISLTRMMQFGGGSREVDAGLIWDAFIDPVSSDNSGRIECDEEFVNQCELGNQLAAVASRFNVQTDTPFSLYFEYSGEDTAKHKNTQLGNLALSAGIFFPFLFDGDWTFLYEYSQWQNAWYVHQIYLDGYTNDGVVMGHWGANHRLPGEQAGATAQVFQFGWQQDRSTRYEISYKSIENEGYAEFDYGAGHFLSVDYFGKLFDQQIAASLLVGKDVFGERLSRVSLQWMW